MSGTGVAILLFEFFQLLPVRDAGYRRHTINNRNALDVVKLMLQSTGVKSFALVGEGFAIEVGGGNGRLAVPFDFCEYTRDRQTPFFIFHKRAFALNCRIYINSDIIPAAIERNYKQAQWDARLGSSKTNAFKLNHKVRYLNDKPTDIVVDFLDRLRGLAQHLCRVMRYMTFFNINRHLDSLIKLIAVKTIA
jgi:hypothetical protein